MADPSNPYEALHAGLGSDNLELVDLGSEPDPGWTTKENSFADASLSSASLDLSAPPEAPPPAAVPVEPAAEPSDPRPPFAEEAKIELDVADDAGPAPKVPKPRQVDKEQQVEPSLAVRGATGVASIPTGPVPVGHVQRARGLFAYDAVANALAAVTIGITVAIVPARLVSASHLDSVGVEGKLEKMEALHVHMERMASPDRGEHDGPQSIHGVVAALKTDAAAIAMNAHAVDEAVVGAKKRFYSVWFGIGVPLGIALTMLRRK